MTTVNPEYKAEALCVVRAHYGEQYRRALAALSRYAGASDGLRS